MKPSFLILFVAFYCLSPPTHNSAFAATEVKENEASTSVTIASAANFQLVLKNLIPIFERETGIQVKASYASTGQLFAQIKNGAPFDVFLSADVARADKLIELDLARGDSSFIYAIGRLVVWSNDESLNLSGNSDRLPDLDCQNRRFAIANPKLAPYGLAAMQTLNSMGLINRCKRIIVGQNVAQVMQFIVSRNISFGFVGMSQLLALPAQKRKNIWIVPPELYLPLEQKAVIISRSENKLAAAKFLQFLASSNAQEQIQQLGYAAP